MTAIDGYIGEATIIQLGARIHAEIRYEVEEGRVYNKLPGMKSWRGTFRATTPVTMQNATLELPDGRTGEIVVVSHDTLDVTPLGSCWRLVLPSGCSGKFEGTKQAPGHS